MNPGYSLRIHPETVAGEPGWWYSVLYLGREVFGGWTRGKKSDALAEIDEGIRAREALRSAVQP